MTTDEQLDQQIGRWLDADAAGHMPDRVYRATFERTRRSRQHRGWRAALGGPHANRLVFHVGAAAVVVAAVLAGGLYTNLGGIASRPSPSPSASP